MLSADVNSCMDPMFAEVSEKDNASFLGYGINLTKYGGARGKSGSNDANAEFLQKIRTISMKPVSAGRSASSARSIRAAAAPSPS